MAKSSLSGRGTAVVCVAVYLATLGLGLTAGVDAQARSRRTAAGGSCTSQLATNLGTSVSGIFRNPLSTGSVQAYCSVVSDTYLGHYEAQSLFVGGNNAGTGYYPVSLPACVRSLSSSVETSRNVNGSIVASPPLWAKLAL